MAADESRDLITLRIRIAWVITGVWALGFPVAALLPTFPVTWAQAPMMAVAGWLFAGPLMRRNGNGGSDDERTGP